MLNMRYYHQKHYIWCVIDHYGGVSSRRHLSQLESIIGGANYKHPEIGNTEI